MLDLDEYKLKSVNDIVRFINFDALDYEENKNFLKEMSVSGDEWGNIFDYLNIDIVLYPRYGTFILESKRVGKQIKALLCNDFDNLKTLKITMADIKHIEKIAQKFNIDLEIKRENMCGKFVYKAYLCGKRVK